LESWQPSGKHVGTESTDRSNPRILNFADNKDLHGGGLSETLTSVPVIDGTQLRNEDKTAPAHTLLQQCVPMHSRFQTPIGYKIIIFARPIILLLLPLVILFTPRHQTNERTSERTVNLLFSRHVHLLLTVTNFLPFASFLFLLTLDRLRR
jgi:hypothetical protein